jgi:hypothetical protein
METRVRVTVIAAVVVFVAPNAAHAWSCSGTSAMTCNPWQQSLHDDAYFQTGGRVKHKDPKIGLIQVFCPVFNPSFFSNTFSSDDTWNTLSVTYKDPDGPGEKYRIIAALRFVDTTGQVGTVTELDSNEQSPGSTTDATMQARITGHEFNFDKRYYYVQIGIDRQDARGAPDVAGYNICYKPS